MRTARGRLAELLNSQSISTRDLSTAIPELAAIAGLSRALQEEQAKIATNHLLRVGDARGLRFVSDESVHLVVTSPPYWVLKHYPERNGQLGDIEDYDAFNHQLSQVWRECHRALTPGGRLVIVVGDVCLSRRKAGRHRVVPLHAAIQENCRVVGFDNLAPIIWYKISNASREVENGSSFLGKPYEPNGIVKNDIEYILMQRKPGGYRTPSQQMRLLSVIPQQDQREWFKQIWTLPGSSSRQHPATFPLQLAERLIQMFSFVTDTVLDPFMGTGTTNVAAALHGRNSVGVDIDSNYVELSLARMQRESDRAGLLAKIQGQGIKG